MRGNIYSTFQLPRWESTEFTQKCELR